MTTNHKKPGPKLKEGVPENVATMLRIDRILYAELSKISVFENIPVYQLINQALRLRINQFIKKAPKRHREHLAEERAKEKEENEKIHNIKGHKYKMGRCDECTTRKLVSIKTGLCDDCRDKEDA